jgi:neutral trehalase
MVSGRSEALRASQDSAREIGRLRAKLAFYVHLRAVEAGQWDIEHRWERWEAEFAPYDQDEA